MKVVFVLILGITVTVVGLKVPATAAEVPSTRVLLLVGGMAHDYDQAPQVMAANLRKMLGEEIKLDFVISKDLDFLKAEKIRAFGLVMFNLCQQTELSADQKSGLLNAVRSGTPVIGLHCSLWSFASWPQFRQMFGAYVAGHAKRSEMCVEVADSSDPITKGVPARFEVYDEPYIVDDRQPSMHSLVRTCNVYKQGERITVKDQNGREAPFVRSGDTGPDRSGPEPQVWTNMFGRGRVLAITLGHDSRTQESGHFLQLLHNGILWALEGEIHSNGRR